MKAFFFISRHVNSSSAANDAMLHNEKVANLNGKKYFFKERTAAGKKKSWGCSPKRRLFGTPPYLCSNSLVPPISCLLKRSITLPNLTLNFPSYEACHRVVIEKCIPAYSSTVNLYLTARCHMSQRAIVELQSA
jgi:hypothetical protein